MLGKVASYSLFLSWRSHCCAGLLFTALLSCGSQLVQGLIMQPLAGLLLASMGGMVEHVRRHLTTFIQLISEGCVVACSAPSILACLFFEIGEFKLTLSNWLTVLHTHMQFHFHVFLMICKRGVGYLPFNFCCLELRMCQTFPILPLRGSIELRPCERCFAPEWIAGMDSFPIHRFI